jgi:RNA methyltransferase, TrmH family
MLSKTFAKYIQSLYHKKNRDAENAFIAEGGKIVMELLQSKRMVCRAIAGTEAWLHANELEIRKYYKGPFHLVTDTELEKISALSTPNQVLALFEKPAALPVAARGRLILLLDDIRDPGNMGTIIRIADWYGIDAIVCSAQSADVYNPKVVQSTMGSLGRVNIVYAGLAEWLKQNKPLKIYAAALQGKNVKETGRIKEGVLIIGNESKGISDEIMQLANETITIPRYGNAESLNAAVATGIILSHVV